MPVAARERTPAAYGLAFEGPLAAGLMPFVAASGEDLPLVRLDLNPRYLDDVTARLSDDRAVIPFLTGGHLVAEREPGTAVFTGTAQLGADAVVHPGLAPVGIVFAHWFARLSFHGGAVAASGRALGILGERGAGKSTTLAGLALCGSEVVADDLVVVDEGDVHRGPRTLDLRLDAATRLTRAGVVLEPVRRGERARLRLGCTAERNTLAGWVILECGQVFREQAVPPSARLRMLASHFALRLPPRAPETLLALAALPMVRITRTERLDELPRTIEAVREFLANVP